MYGTITRPLTAIIATICRIKTPKTAFSSDELSLLCQLLLRERERERERDKRNLTSKVYNRKITSWVPNKLNQNVEVIIHFFARNNVAARSRIVSLTKS